MTYEKYVLTQNNWVQKPELLYIFDRETSIKVGLGFPSHRRVMSATGKSRPDFFEFCSSCLYHRERKCPGGIDALANTSFNRTLFYPYENDTRRTWITTPSCQKRLLNWDFNREVEESFRDAPITRETDLPPFMISIPLNFEVNMGLFALNPEDPTKGLPYILGNTESGLDEYEEVDLDVNTGYWCVGNTLRNFNSFDGRFENEDFLREVVDDHLLKGTFNRDIWPRYLYNNVVGRNIEYPSDIMFDHDWSFMSEAHETPEGIPLHRYKLLTGGFNNEEPLSMSVFPYSMWKALYYRSQTNDLILENHQGDYFFLLRLYPNTVTLEKVTEENRADFIAGLSE